MLSVNPHHALDNAHLILDKLCSGRFNTDKNQPPIGIYTETDVAHSFFIHISFAAYHLRRVS